MSMKTLARTAVALLLGVPAGAQAQARAVLQQNVLQFVSVNAPVVALTNVRLVDGTGAPVRTNQTIIIDGARIQWAGPASRASIPAGARVIDLGGHTVIPGLVQLHEHTYFGGLRTMTPNPSSAPLYLAMGVTTAMSAGSQYPYHELNLKRAIDAGAMPGPRLHASGPYLNSGPPRPALSALVNTADEVRRVIDYWAAEGATWFKFGGTVSRELLGAAVRHAHSIGVKVTGHLCSVTFTEAATLGVDLLQHGFITNSDYVDHKQPDSCPSQNMRIQADVDVSSARVQETIRQIVTRGTAVASTLGVYETFSPGRAKLDPRGLEMLHPDARREVEAIHANIAQSGLTVPERLLKKMMQWERAFVAAGGLLGAGSDPWGTGFLPGFGNLRNFELFVEAGFTPEAAIQIMTLNGARILGEERRLGSIVAGQLADLIVIRGDPVRTPAEIYDVVTVFKDGIGYDSARLRESVRGRIGI